MDALASLLEQVRSRGALFGRNVVEPPWSVRFAEDSPLTLVTMLRGSGWIVPDDADPVPVGGTDVAVVVGTRPFTVAHDRDASAPPLYVLLPGNRCTAADGSAPTDDLWLGPRTCGARLDGPTVLLTGTYPVRGHASARLVRALPRVLVVPRTGQLGPAVELTVAEIEREEPGQQAVLDRLLDLLLLSALREWFARPDVEPPAWYRALGDPVVGRALRLLHEDPARPWTVAALAEEAGVARATLARRFTELVGEPPMAYLTGWRLCLAADLLAGTDATVEAVARRVGYGSGFGLSVAFTRVYGTRPSAFRTPAPA
ncbi:AraC family transcriptional regulator [Geodermatophilus sp. SYSU D01105]